MSTKWDLSTEKDFLVHGVGWGVLPGYLVSFIALQVWGLFGRGGNVKYVQPPLFPFELNQVAILNLPRLVRLRSIHPPSPVASNPHPSPYNTVETTTFSNTFNPAQAEYITDSVTGTSRPAMDPRPPFLRTACTSRRCDSWSDGRE